MRRALLLLVVAVLMPGVAYAGGGGHFSVCPGHAEGNSIVLLDSCFSGTAHFAPVDQTLTVRNDGGFPHDFTAVDGSFATGILETGESAEITVTETGIYRVFCTLHGNPSGEGMAGVLIVGEAEPGMVKASLDLTPVEAAVAAQTDLILQAMDSQGRAMGKITSTQDDIAVAMNQLASNGDSEPLPAAASSTAPAASADIHLSSAAVGLAIGLVVMALATMLRRNRSASHDA